MPLLTDAFSTGPADDAFKRIAGGYKKAFQDTRKFGGQGMRQVNRSLAGTQRAGLREYNRGEARGQGYLEPVQDQWSQITDAANRGADLYADVSGVNGPGGNARAMENFQESPSYQYTLDQQEEALNRTANARGGLTGGANMLDVMRNAYGQSSQEYDKYVSRLLPYLNQQVAGAQGAAGTAANQAELAFNSGQGRAGLRKDVGVLRAGNIGKFYDQLVDAATSRATGTAQAGANADMAAYTASSNLWDTALGVGKLVASF